MSLYFRKMHGNRWQTLEVTDEEVEQVTVEYFKNSMRMMERVILNIDNMTKKSEKLKGAGVSPEMRDKMALALMEKMLSPLHFAIDTYVENKLAKEVL